MRPGLNVAFEPPESPRVWLGLSAVGRVAVASFLGARRAALVALIRELPVDRDVRASTFPKPLEERAHDVANQRRSVRPVAIGGMS